MAGMTDTAFRRLVKRHGGCGLVVTEMVSSEGLVRGIDRTLEYAEYTEEERPVSIQIFGGDPDKMAAAAQIVEGMGADIVDVNMGCPVPKIAKHNAGCSLMREPAHAASGDRGDGEGGEDSGDRQDARRLERRRAERADAGAGWSRTPAPRRSPSTAAPRRRATADRPTGISSREIADDLTIPVFGSGDCIEPEQIVDRLRSGVDGVLVGRGVLRNPWILAQAADLVAGRPARPVTLEDRGQFLLDYIDCCCTSACDETRALTHDRWVINKVRALGSWYTKGLDNGSHLRTADQHADSLPLAARDDRAFFLAGQPASL